MNLYRSGEALREEMDRTNLPLDQSVAMWALGQEGFLFKLGNKTVLIDPYLTDSINQSPDSIWKRKFPPPIAPEQLPLLDYVICTHQHTDHMDVASLLPLQSRERTKFLVPRAHAGRLLGWGFYPEQLIGMNHGEVMEEDGLVIKAFAAMHDTFERDEDGNHKFLGYVLKFGGLTVYHAGDTIGFPQLVEWLKPEQVDVALIPMNGRDFVRTSQRIIGNCNYREAADLAVAIGADLVIPMHYGMFPHNDENPAYFVDYLYTHYPQQKFHMMTPGERFVYIK